MKVWNIIKIKTIIGKYGETRMDISTVLTTFDEETAKRNFDGLSSNGSVSTDGTCVVFSYGRTEIIYRLVSSPLVLSDKHIVNDINNLYCAYKELLVSRLKQWGEKEVSRMGDEIYRLDITEMDYHIGSNDLPLVEEVVLQVNGNKEYVSFNLDNGKYVTLNNFGFVHIEKLVSFIAELTKFMSNR